MQFTQATPAISHVAHVAAPSEDGRVRVAIERVSPSVDSGRFPIKRLLGQTVEVQADVFADGHDVVSAVVRYRHETTERWSEAPLTLQKEDRWTGKFLVDQLGTFRYTVRGWVDHFETWRRDMRKRVDAGQAAEVDRLIGAELVAEAANRARGPAKELLEHFEDQLRGTHGEQLISAIIDDDALKHLMFRWAPRQFAATHPELLATVERGRAGFSAWYEMFPRSAADEYRHGTLRDVEARLPYVASMGFDVLYLPPIHPIGKSFRKGRNNAAEAAPGDVGSPWGIGAADGGHKAVHRDLGNMDDFHRLVAAAAQHGLELALDIAFQCSPDHPYVKNHPEWFRHRPDGTIQYAENPPKKYQDIYPLDFECEDWPALWNELKSIFLFWIHQGVRIFRVDNPHTKPFSFWEWVIAEIRRDHPDAIFLAEAFTRPAVMYRLAKAGFSQSYTYFTWRNTKHELTEYCTELANPAIAEFFRPNLWPNTPDILPEPLQIGGRGAFMARGALAATLSGNYGIYGPPFEHGWSAPIKPGSEEYVNSEKYQVHHHDLDRPDSLRDFIARLNAIRRGSAALAQSGALRFHRTDNEQLLCYSRTTSDMSEALVIVVNLHPYHTHSGWIELPLEWLRLPLDRPYQMHDLMTDERYLWQGAHNFVQLNPSICPVHVFRVRRFVRSEHNFEYFQ